MIFQQLVEKISNPLRKKSLGDHPSNLEQSKQFLKDWKDSIIAGVFADDEDKAIHAKYQQYKNQFPERADKWLDKMAKYYADQFLRSKVEKGSVKIYEHKGIQVFLDNSVTESFDEGSKKLEVLKSSVDNLASYIWDILPNRKPRIVITNSKTNPLFSGTYAEDPIGLYYDRIIYIDQYNINNPKTFIHEYAHYVADLIPQQTKPLLQRAYNQMLDKYWRKYKVKKQRLEPEDPSDSEQSELAKKWRMKISTKLGFPQYGLMNPDEFFAVLIENWKEFPNNSATYQYKSIVKNVLTRL